MTNTTTLVEGLREWPERLISIVEQNGDFNDAIGNDDLQGIAIIMNKAADEITRLQRENEALREALAELVRLKDLKEKCDELQRQGYDYTDNYPPYNEYMRCKRIAWHCARKAISTPAGRWCRITRTRLKCTTSFMRRRIQMPIHNHMDETDNEHNAIATKLLCELMEGFRIGEPIITEELEEWWETHNDRERRRGLPPWA